MSLSILGPSPLSSMPSPKIRHSTDKFYQKHLQEVYYLMTPWLRYCSASASLFWSTSIVIVIFNTKVEENKRKSFSNCCCICSIQVTIYHLEVLGRVDLEGTMGNTPSTISAMKKQWCREPSSLKCSQGILLGMISRWVSSDSHTISTISTYCFYCLGWKSSVLPI